MSPSECRNGTDDPWGKYHPAPALVGMRIVIRPLLPRKSIIDCYQKDRPLQRGSLNQKRGATNKQAG
jgi:hypothetical protein